MFFLVCQVLFVKKSVQQHFCFANHVRIPLFIEKRSNIRPVTPISVFYVHGQVHAAAMQWPQFTLDFPADL